MNDSLYGSEGNAEENEKDESRHISEGSPHYVILSRILCAARILGFETQEEATAPKQGVWVSISRTPPTSIYVDEYYSQMLRKA